MGASTRCFCLLRCLAESCRRLCWAGLCHPTAAVLACSTCMMVCCRSNKLPSKEVSFAAGTSIPCLRALLLWEADLHRPCCCLVLSIGLDCPWTSILLRLLSFVQAKLML